LLVLAVHHAAESYGYTMCLLMQQIAATIVAIVAAISCSDNRRLSVREIVFSDCMLYSY